MVCQALYNYVYSSAINSLGVSFACVMTYMAPAFASVISYFLFREKFGPNKYLAMILNLAGCVLTVTGGSLKGMSFAASGLLFGLASAACYSLVGIFGRLASGESSPFVVATYNFLFGTIYSCVISQRFNHSFAHYLLLSTVCRTWGRNLLLLIGRCPPAKATGIIFFVVISIILSPLIFHDCKNRL